MKTYKIFCHVCNEVKEVKAQFISARDWTATDKDGMSYPIGTCNADQSGQLVRHSGDAVRESYAHMMQRRYDPAMGEGL